MQQVNSGRLGFGRLTGYGVGDFGINLYWGLTNLFAMFYYTDVLGLPNATAGYVIMGAMIWDAVSDPLFGVIASRTKSRWGRYRPYLIFGAIPLAVSFVLMFSRPNFEGAQLAAYAFATQILFRTCYTIVGVPYSSLMARLTQNANARGAMSVARILFGALATILVSLFTLKSAATLGDGDMAAGFGKITVIFALMSIVALTICFFATREDETVQDDIAPALRDVLRMLRTNTAFWVAFMAVLLAAVGGTINGKALIYYLKYNLNAEAMIGTVTALMGLSVLFAVPLWGALSKRIGKQRVWFIGTLISVLAGVAVYLNPSADPWIYAGILLVGSAGLASNYFSTWSTIPDTVEYGEWKTGVRAEAVLFGVISFAQKLALGVATGLIGLSLDLIGYRANEVQSPETLEGLRMLASLVPAGISLCALLVISRYALDQDAHAAIIKELNNRSSQKA